MRKWLWRVLVLFVAASACKDFLKEVLIVLWDRVCEGLFGIPWESTLFDEA